MRWFAQRGISFDPKVWDQWEKTGAGKAKAMPGSVEMVNKLRAAGITVIANTNRNAANARGSEGTLRAAGLGEFRHGERSEEHTSELQSLMRISYAVFCWNKQNNNRYTKPH